MSVLSFPFDVQLCALQFGSWTYQSHALSFNVLEASVNENNVKCNFPPLSIQSYITEKLRMGYRSVQCNEKSFKVYEFDWR